MWTTLWITAFENAAKQTAAWHRAGLPHKSATDNASRSTSYLHLSGCCRACGRARAVSARLWSCRVASALALRVTEALTIRPVDGVWSVGGLIGAVAAVLEHGFGACTVAGEISGWSRASSGHCYFNLKDVAGGAALRCAMFRRASSFLAFPPADGQAVQLRGRLAVYEARGELQFIVEAMQKSGAGALYEQFLRLRSRLEDEGCFAAGGKRLLPAHPVAIGIVTSLAGAALHDVVTTLARRSPHVRVVIYPSLVQGADAPAALCLALALASGRAEVDVLIVCRGGGSLEDLWAFNDERVVRALCAVSMPVISGVGHETDVTLADLAADVRAATPTAAAEIAAPETATQLRALGSTDATMVRRTLAALDMQAQRVDRLALRMSRPGDGVRSRVLAIDSLQQRLTAAPLREVELRWSLAAATTRRLCRAAATTQALLGSRLERAALHLVALDPNRVLARGYALLTDDAGHTVTSVASLTVGVTVGARFADGEARLEVRSTQRRPSP
ncbi:MAG: exodeoxyribonuclease VII large subunit [Caldimonas sp.]